MWNDEASRVSAVRSDRFMVLYRKAHKWDFFGITPTPKKLSFPVGTEIFDVIFFADVRYSDGVW